MPLGLRAADPAAACPRRDTAMVARGWWGWWGQRGRRGSSYDNGWRDKRWTLSSPRSLQPFPSLRPPSSPCFSALAALARSGWHPACGSACSADTVQSVCHPKQRSVFILGFTRSWLLLLLQLLLRHYSRVRDNEYWDALWLSRTPLL